MSSTWITEHLEKHLDFDMRFENAKHGCIHGTSNLENCPCYATHKSDEHTAECHRYIIVETNDEDNFTFRLDRRQIHSIRWDNSGQKWIGLCKSKVADGRDDVAELTDDWVKENFSLEEIDAWKERGKQHRVFVKIPPGAPRDDCSIPDALIRKDAPAIQFRQEEGFCCVTNGLSSALHFLNEHVMAVQLHEFGQSLTTGGKQRNDAIIGETREFMRRQGKAWTPYKVNHAVDLLDQRSYHTSTSPRLVVLEADDGDAGHAVTIVGGWIFDSNFASALPLCRASFDFICADGRAMVGFRIAYDFHSPTGVASTTPKSKSRRRKRKRKQDVLFEDDAGSIK